MNLECFCFPSAILGYLSNTNPLTIQLPPTLLPSGTRLKPAVHRSPIKRHELFEPKQSVERNGRNIVNFVASSKVVEALQGKRKALCIGVSSDYL